MLSFRKRVQNDPVDPDLDRRIEDRLATISSREPGSLRRVIERRLFMRRRVDLPAVIHPFDGDSEDERRTCTITDKTRTGFRLRVLVSESLPDRFYLYVPDLELRRLVRIRWVEGDEAGVDFDDVDASTDAGDRLLAD